jgi:cell division protease FtsH
MSPKVGMVSIARSDGGFLGGDIMPEMGREISEETASLVDEEVRRIVTECFARAADTLLREKSRLIALAETLLRRESLDEREMLDVTGLTGIAASKLSPLSQKIINVLPDASDTIVGLPTGLVTENETAPVPMKTDPA